MTIPEMMTPEEERILFENWNSESWKILVEKNMRLVLCAVQKYSRPVIDKDDYIGMGNMALVQAAKKFDPKMNVKFSTFATNCIHNHIHAWTRKYRNKDQCLSINIPCRSDLYVSYDHEEALLDHNDLESYVLMRETIESTINGFSARDQEVIRKYLCGYMQSELASMYGVSRITIHSILKKFKIKLSKELK